MRVVHFIPLILGLLGFSSQQVFALCTGSLVPGCEYCARNPHECSLRSPDEIDQARAQCKDNPASCGIVQQTTTVTVPDLEGGKKNCLDNLSACAVNGSTSGDAQLNTAKNNGVTEGKNACINNPSSCGISSQNPNAIAAAKSEGRAECINNPSDCGITKQDPDAVTNAVTSVLPIYDLKNESLVLPKYRVRNKNGSFDDAAGKDGATIQYTGEWVFDNKNNYYLQLLLKKLPPISDELIAPQSGLINFKKLGDGRIYYTSNVDATTVTVVAKSDKNLINPILFDSYCESVTTKKEGETMSVIEVATPDRSSPSSSTVAFITNTQISSPPARVSVSPPFTTCSFSITKGTLTSRQISITFPSK